MGKLSLCQHRKGMQWEWEYSSTNS